MKLTATLKIERETKGAVLYHEVDKAGKQIDIKEGIVGRLYIRKDKLNGTTPDKIVVTVTG